MRSSPCSPPATSSGRRHDAPRPGLPPAITDEAVAILRARIGIPEPHPQPPHYRRPGIDAFRNTAIAYGDDNPLWCDPDYAAKTRWEGPIASPVLVGGDTLIGEDEVTRVPEEHRELMKGDPLRGRARVLRGQRPRMVGAAAAGAADLAPQRAGRHPRQGERVRRAGRPRVDRAGLRRPMTARCCPASTG